MRGTSEVPISLDTDEPTPALRLGFFVAPNKMGYDCYRGGIAIIVAIGAC
jgi:hypothetical protein